MGSCSLIYIYVCFRLRRELGVARQTAVRETDARQRALADLAAATEAEEGLRRRSERDMAAMRQTLLEYDVSISKNFFAHLL